jgi:rhodanese-related sulfurtransferase
MNLSGWGRGFCPAARTAVLIAAAAAALGLGVNALRPGSLPFFPAAPSAATSSPVQTISLEELRGHLARGSAVLVDARNPKDFAAGHAPGALNIPAQPRGSYLSRVFEWLSPDELILIYCAAPGCHLSRDLAAQLISNGFSAERVRVFEPGWKALREEYQGAGSAAGR